MALKITRQDKCFIVTGSAKDISHLNFYDENFEDLEGCLTCNDELIKSVEFDMPVNKVVINFVDWVEEFASELRDVIYQGMKGVGPVIQGITRYDKWKTTFHLTDEQTILLLNNCILRNINPQEDLFTEYSIISEVYTSFSGNGRNTITVEVEKLDEDEALDDLKVAIEWAKDNASD